MLLCCTQLKFDFNLTSGSTGFSKWDFTYNDTFDLLRIILVRLHFQKSWCSSSPAVTRNYFSSWPFLLEDGKCWIWILVVLIQSLSLWHFNSFLRTNDDFWSCRKIIWWMIFSLWFIALTQITGFIKNQQNYFILCY